MSTLTYLAHSGFLLEWAGALWLFDYWQGPLPPLDPEKPLFILASHRHEDHFNPEIFRIPHPCARYVLSDDIRLSPSHSRRWPASPKAEVLFVAPNGQYALDCPGGPLRLETLPSTDEGVAFVLTCGETTVYHAGDLNWWDWPGEGPAWNDPMAARFQAAVAPLTGRKLALAMVPLDPRQEGSYALGLTHLLKIAQVERAVPMHFWEGDSVVERFLREYPQFAEILCPLTTPGERLELPW